MPRSVFFKEAGAIGDTDINALPVKEIGPAVGYYTQCLGFTLASKDRTTAVLRRDDVQIGLAVNGRDPEQASCWFSVGEVDALWREFDAKGIEPGIIDEEEYGGKPLRVFAKCNRVQVATPACNPDQTHYGRGGHLLKMDERSFPFVRGDSRWRSRHKLACGLITGSTRLGLSATYWLQDRLRCS